MKNPLIFLFALSLAWLTTGNCAAAGQSHEAIHEAALAFAQTQARDLPGEVSIQISRIDPRLSLPLCASLQPFLPTGAALMGKTSIGVRCDGKPGWSVLVQATIRVSANLLVTSRPLPQYTVLGNSDFVLQKGELTQPGQITAPAQVLGQVVRFPLGAGLVLRRDMLRPPFVILQGKTVPLVARGDGYAVRTEGQAMNNAAAAEPVHIRIASGQLIAAVANADGSAVVAP